MSQLDRHGAIIIVAGERDGRAGKVHEGFRDIEASFICDCLQELVSAQVHLDDLTGGLRIIEDLEPGFESFAGDDGHGFKTKLMVA